MLNENYESNNQSETSGYGICLIQDHIQISNRII